MKQLLTNIKFSRNCPKISQIHKNGNSFKYNWKEVDQLLLSYKFYGRDM